MTEDEGTPGPWWFRYSNFDEAKLLVYVQGNRGTCLDHVCIVPPQYDVELRDDPPTKTRNAGRQEANARLLAAAPDLLAACAAALAALEHTVRRQRDMVDGTQHEAMRAVRAALEKARGT